MLALGLPSAVPCQLTACCPPWTAVSAPPWPLLSAWLRNGERLGFPVQGKFPNIIAGRWPSGMLACPEDLACLSRGAITGSALTSLTQLLVYFFFSGHLFVFSACVVFSFAL